MVRIVDRQVETSPLPLYRSHPSYATSHNDSDNNIRKGSYTAMASNKKIVDEVPGWIRVFEDGTVDRTWTGTPEMEPLLKPVSPHEEFINGVAVRDQIIDPKTGLAVRIYVPGNEEQCPDQS
ncbi:CARBOXYLESTERASE 15-RELATED [Salix koriyanagi]|uniref:CARBOXYLESTERASE 15-RELATED n=1 Tax=Salix koriyanagi TaxID=2511006 RepID=A0A9Q0X4S6_9ROSI|nr:CARBOXYLESTERASE 15-RELATED [Salix koriyanagi]